MSEAPTRRRAARRRGPIPDGRDAQAPGPTASGLVVARVARLTDDGVWLHLPGETRPARALACCCDRGSLAGGAPVAVSFDGGDPARPVVLGPILAGLDTPASGNGVEIRSDSEISLVCGKASLKLTSDGNAALRGVNVTTRASRTNRIRGGNVQIN